jgi:nitrogen-specific signal transduction histidine kinase
VHVDDRVAAAGEVVRAPDGTPERVLGTFAVEFTEHGGAVRIMHGTAPHEVRIHVRDTGRGLPAHRLDAVFAPFVHAGNPLTAENRARASARCLTDT